MSTRDFSWGKGGPCVRLTIYHRCSVERQENPGPYPTRNPLDHLGLLWETFTFYNRLYFLELKNVLWFTHFKIFKSNSGSRGNANFSQCREMVNTECLSQPQPAALRTPGSPSFHLTSCFSLYIVGLLLMLIEGNKYNVDGTNEQSDGPNKPTTCVHSFSDSSL
jgi:hypothetical protein